MKKLLTILFLLSVIAVSAQQGQGKIYAGEFQTGEHRPQGYFDSALHIPVLKDTFLVRDNSKYKDSAEIAIFQGEFWYKLPRGYWKKGGSGNGNGGTVDLSGYYRKTQVDSAVAAKSIDAIIDTSLTGSAINADPLRVNPNLTLTTVTTTQQTYPFTGYTVNTGEKVGFQFFKNTDGSISIQAALIGSNSAAGAMKTTEGETLKTTEGETIIFN